MSAKTENNHIFGTMTDSVEIEQQIRDFRLRRGRQKCCQVISTMTDSPNSQMGPKTSILLLPVVGRCRSRPGTVFQAQICHWNFDPLSHIFRSISDFRGHIAISGCRSPLQLLDDTYFDMWS